MLIFFHLKLWSIRFSDNENYRSFHGRVDVYVICCNSSGNGSPVNHDRYLQTNVTRTQQYGGHDAAFG